jgi:hypothetical protein
LNQPDSIRDTWSQGQQMADSATETKGPDGKPAEPPVTPDLSKAADGLVAKHGDPTAALLVLLGENYKARDTVRELKAKLPADGSLVLTGDDAKAWSRYRAAGDPKTVEAALTERDAYRTEAEGYRRDKHHADVAAVAGYKPAVLTRLATTDGLSLRVDDGKDKLGKPVKLAVVVAKGADDKETVTPLADYAAAHWQDFLPALAAVSAARPLPTGTPAPRHETPPRPAVAVEKNGEPRRRVNQF